jgi:hypothetical protein
MENIDSKVLITGTGRCGTTFLIRLFTFLDFDTGWTKQNYYKNIFANSNSGMERSLNDPYYILKSPSFMEQLETIIKMNIKLVIIPIRDYDESASSRVRHGRNTGGMWNATNKQEQINHYNKIMANYIYYMCKYNIKTLFLDFDRMVTNPEYLYNELKELLNEKMISFKYFKDIYNEVSKIS